jgi:hypothetical protein
MLDAIHKQAIAVVLTDRTGITHTHWFVAGSLGIGWYQ